MKKNNFSVLMSVYYKEKPNYLKNSLDSIFNQTLKAGEVILIEDGELTNELERLIVNYEKKYKEFKVVRFKQNRGLGIALNEGLKFCSYDYIARMDSDDIAVKDRFEKQYNFILNNPKVDVVGGNIMEFDDVTENDISLRKVPKKNSEILIYLRKRNPMNHVTVMFKKSSVEQVGGYQDCPFFEDYYLWARMLKKQYIFENIDDVLVRVRAGLSMSGRRGNLTYIKCIINFENKLLNLKLINKYEFFYNVMVRAIISIMPNKLRYFIYQKRLRNEKD